MGHTKDALGEPTIVKKLMNKFVTVRNSRNLRLCHEFSRNSTFQRVKCTSTFTIASTDMNVIVAFGTRYGIPEFHFNEVPPTPNSPSSFAQIGNNTAAFTNFLTSVYKSETMLEPTELLGLYSSAELLEKGIYLKLLDVFPLQHSVLVWVDTTSPLK